MSDTQTPLTVKVGKNLWDERISTNEPLDAAIKLCAYCNKRPAEWLSEVQSKYYTKPRMVRTFWCGRCYGNYKRGYERQTKKPLPGRWIEYINATVYRNPPLTKPSRS